MGSIQGDAGWGTAARLAPRWRRGGQVHPQTGAVLRAGWLPAEGLSSSSFPAELEWRCCSCCWESWPCAAPPAHLLVQESRPLTTGTEGSDAAQVSDPAPRCPAPSPGPMIPLGSPFLEGCPAPPPASPERDPPVHKEPVRRETETTWTCACGPVACSAGAPAALDGPHATTVLALPTQKARPCASQGPLAGLRVRRPGSQGLRDMPADPRRLPAASSHRADLSVLRVPSPAGTRAQGPKCRNAPWSAAGPCPGDTMRDAVGSSVKKM